MCLDKQAPTVEKRFRKTANGRFLGWKAFLRSPQGHLEGFYGDFPLPRWRNRWLHSEDFGKGDRALDANNEEYVLGWHAFARRAGARHWCRVWGRTGGGTVTLYGAVVRQVELQTPVAFGPQTCNGVTVPVGVFKLMKILPNQERSK